MKYLSTIIFFVSTPLLFADGGPWIQKSSFPAEGRHRTTGFAIGNKGYIGLGHYNSGPLGNVAKADIWEYDPSNDSWTQKADYPVATYGATAFTIGNYAYVGGHVSGQNEFYEFDPTENVWTSIASSPLGGSDQSSFTIDTLGYFLTGSGFYAYDPQTDIWILKTSPPTSSYSWEVAFSIDGKGYYLATGGGFYEYKPSTDEWTNRTSFPGETIGGWSAFVINGEAYICTGYVQFLNPVSREVWKFKPELNEWFQLEEFPGSKRRFSSAFSINGKGYLGSGTNGTNFNDLWEFNPNLTNITKQNLVSTQVYPNPSTDQIIFNLSKPIHNYTELQIYTLKGELKEIIPFNNQSLTLYNNNLGKGSYIYLIRTNDKIIDQGKIIFQ